MELVQKAIQFFLLTVIFLNDIGCLFFYFYGILFYGLSPVMSL